MGRGSIATTKVTTMTHGAPYGKNINFAGYAHTNEEHAHEEPAPAHGDRDATQEPYELATVECGMRHNYPHASYVRLKSLQPILIPQGQHDPYTADVNMLNLCTPSHGGFLHLRNTLCVNRFLGRLHCLERPCIFRHDDSNAKSHSGIFQWFQDLEREAEVDHMHSFQGRIYLSLSYHPKFMEQCCDSNDPYVLRDKHHRVLDRTALQQVFMGRTHNTTGRTAVSAKTAGLEVLAHPRDDVSCTQSRLLADMSRASVHNIKYMLIWNVYNMELNCVRGQQVAPYHMSS